MQKLDKKQEERRKLIAVLGMGAVAAPVLGLTGCGGGDSEPASSSSTADSMADQAGSAMQKAEKRVEETMEAAESTMEESMDSAADAMDDAQSAVEDTVEEAAAAVEDMAEEVQNNVTGGAAAARVDENSPQAAGLAYRHDATQVDASAQPRYATGQQCSNCVLFQGGSAEWGGCPLFAGQLVKSTGWCSAYSAAG